MTEAQFWELIERSRDQSSDCETQAQALHPLLLQLPASEILEFDSLFHHQLNRTYHWDVWGVIDLIQGFCSDDGFEYVRCWLIGRGREAFERVLADPQTVLDLIEVHSTHLKCEALLYGAMKAYEAVVGETGSFTDQIYPPGLFETSHSPASLEPASTGSFSPDLCDSDRPPEPLD